MFIEWPWLQQHLQRELESSTWGELTEAQMARWRVDRFGGIGFGSGPNVPEAHWTSLVRVRVVVMPIVVK